MDRKISHLEPKIIWSYFEDICQVPRPSKKEEQIISFMEQFAKKNKLEYQIDKAGNVLIKKGATQGYENRPTVILQSHLDMVCEKNSEVEHDFMKDPILAYIDGDWVKAKGTTLGADCGIGVASAMAVLTDETLKHGPIEAIFTVDEETGLTGAAALQPGFLSGNILINLDSEDEGELFIGCAGGVDTVINFSYQKLEIPAGYFPLEIQVAGLMGGHSGDDIDRGRANANKLLVRFLWAAYHKFGFKLANIDGGNLRNAIAREAKAIVLIQNGYKENLVADFNVFKHDVAAEIALNEPDFKMTMGSAQMPDFVLDDLTTEKILNSLYACPHGVHTMSSKMPGMVETSTNLASVKMKVESIIEVTTSQRSDVKSGIADISSMVAAVFTMAGASIRTTDGYPGWTPNPDSPILAVTEKSYESLFKHKPVVRSIHAGLECGLFLEKYPTLDMVSFGPTIKGVHSPDERINIKTVDQFWKHLTEVLKNIPAI
ncbi:MAG: aminoacyl-histidine dipeptidase [Prolixibacteraceae bacterium]